MHQLLNLFVIPEKIIKLKIELFKNFSGGKMQAFRYFLVVLVFISFNLTLLSEDKEMQPLNLGPYLGVNLNMHTPEFDLPLGFYDGSQSVLFNESATSFGFAGGLVVNIPLTDIFTLSPRIGFNMLGGELSKNSSLAGDTTIDNNFEANLNYLEITPAVIFENVIPIEDLYLLAGIELGVPLTNTQTHTAALVEPDGTFLPEGASTRTFAKDEDIPDAAMRLALALGAGYTFEISDNVFLSPEASFRFPFTQVSTADAFDSWDVPQIRFGINLTFGFGDDEEEPDRESTIDAGFKSIRSFNKNGEPVEVSKVIVEEVQYNELFPLLPYVFYGKNSDQPVESAQELSASEETGEFTISVLEAEHISINKKTLDIIGLRMKNNKNAKLTITGTNDGKDETSNADISKKRAEFAKNYLIVNYGVSPDNIEVRSAGLPAKASAVNDPDGQQENRRIEFSSDNPKILEPIIINKDKQTVAIPDLIEFVPYAESTDSITSWSLDITQSGKVVRQHTAPGEPQKYRWKVKPNDLQASEIPVEYTLTARNSAGKNAMKSGTIPIEFVKLSRKKEEDRPDKAISKFSLIVFDFDSPEISPQDKKIIDEHVIPSIKYNSTVQIYGYTDRIGNEDYNKKLALQRANNVKSYLESKAKSAKYEVFGIGENILVFDNDNPIGRQLSRTVQVYVITPKE